jgi:hypothetical protein
MIYHLVWFKMKDGATDADKEALAAGLRAMIPGIPEIVELTVGNDFSGRSRGFEVGLYVKTKTREDLDVYAKHPVHLDFIERHKHLWQDVQALDFEE